MTTSRAFWDAIDRAKRNLTATPPDADIEMGDYDDDIGDELADRDLTECRDCYGTDPICPNCHGCGWLRA